MLQREERTGLIYAGAQYYAGAKRKSRMGGNPWLGRWLSVDPLAEAYYVWSPYSYVVNNPLTIVNPDGKQVRTETRIY
ncbi:RHS repeat-associated core domain-containing protein [Lutibacter sp.]